MVSQFRKLLMVFVCLWFLIGIGSVSAQASSHPPQVFITRTDATSPPTLEVQAYGLTSQGNWLDFTAEPFTIMHNGTTASTTAVAGTREVGTLTIFLIDIPSGVSAQFTDITNAINQFAAAPTMKEQVDAIAVYQVGETGARELLAPTTFYNSVRNTFAAPLTPATGATALVDSAIGLLDQINSLKPNPQMAASLIIMSDGTDSVSTLHQPEEVAARAAATGIPVHTFWLNNADLSAGSQQFGQDYLTTVSSHSRGLSVKLENQGDWALIWNVIAAFRNQTVIRYTVSAIQGGQFGVTLSLTNQPDVAATADIVVPTNVPLISLNLPLESRSLSLPNLDDPVKLRFTTTLSWLDGVQRQVTAAQLVVNSVPQEIPVAELADFEAELTSLRFGTNTVEVAILDDQGMRVSSPTVVLQLTEGERAIPAELSTGGGFWSNVGRVALILVIIAIVLAGGLFIWRQGWLTGVKLPTSLPRGRRRGQPTVTYEDATDVPSSLARLAVMECVSPMPAEIPIHGPQIRLGRSPVQADIAFEQDVTMSRQHAVLMLEGTHYRIFDEGSTSGTWVNDKTVPDYGTQLMDGDEIRLGAVVLRYYQP